MNTARPPEDNRSEYPGPEELPKERWPPVESIIVRWARLGRQCRGRMRYVPFPTSALLHLSLHGSAMDLGPGDTEAIVELARNKVHKDSEEKLCELLVVDASHLEQQHSSI